MKALIITLALCLLAVCLFSCNQSKVYTLKSISTGFEIDSEMDLSQYKLGDTVMLLKYPGDIKHNEFVELQIIAIK